MGFAETMRSIVSNLPSQRQTLLFSATMTKNLERMGEVFKGSMMSLFNKLTLIPLMSR